MEKVFVYGTLKKGEPNHSWLTKPENGYSKFIGTAETLEKYPLIIATKYNVPFMLYKPGTGHYVKGEIYEVNEKMLLKLDTLEEHPTFYEREKYIVKNISGDVEETCWIYFLKKFKPHLLEREFYEEYRHDGPHNLKYLERYLRNPSDFSWKEEVHL